MLKKKKAANANDDINIGSVDMARMLDMCIGEGHCGYQGEGVCPLRNNINCLFDLARMAADRLREMQREQERMRTLLGAYAQFDEPCKLCAHSNWPDDCPMDCMECDHTDCACMECRDSDRFEASRKAKAGMRGVANK